ncbi:Tyrosine--tRNA ligase, cytoplasmic [Dictyocoela muelleri]|nr:Tyrosine--tRNA ligase, cytoplasmic [Dictyocoela muelleri]
MKFEIRVGRILKIWDHPNSDLYYIEDVDVGKNIRVISRLRKSVNKDYLLGKYFIFIVNLIESELVGEKYEGMIMCAKNEKIARPIVAPVDKPGELLYLNEKNKFSYPGKVERGSEHFNDFMNKFSIKDYKLLFDNDFVLCDGKNVCSDVVENGIVG